MNRHDRRAARAHECLAPYTADGGPGAHAPADCDGTCRARVTELPPALMLACAQLACGGPEEVAIRLLVLSAREDLARMRAVALAPFTARLRQLGGSAWERLRASLEARGLIRPVRFNGPRGVAGVIVACCPRTGPPSLAAASGVPVFSP
jgi:hypothetical protein